jgi:hypothetical protein
MESKKHTNEPWWTNGIEIGDVPMMNTKICNRVSGNSHEEAKANAERIVACVNACAGFSESELETLGHFKAMHETIIEENLKFRAAIGQQSIEMVQLATAHRDACVEWETRMMAAIGEDSVSSVFNAIEKLRNERDELKKALSNGK